MRRASTCLCSSALATCKACSAFFRAAISRSSSCVLRLNMGSLCCHQDGSTSPAPFRDSPPAKESPRFCLRPARSRRRCPDLRRELCSLEGLARRQSPLQHVKCSAATGRMVYPWDSGVKRAFCSAFRVSLPAMSRPGVANYSTECGLESASLTACCMTVCSLHVRDSSSLIRSRRLSHLETPSAHLEWQGLASQGRRLPTYAMNNHASHHNRGGAR